MIALGVFVAWLLSMTLVPLTLYLLPLSEGKETKNSHLWIDSFANWVIKRHKALIAANLLVIIVTAPMVSHNNIAERWHDFFDTSFEVRRTTDHVEQSLESLHSLFFIADSQVDNGINRVEFLKQLDHFSEWLKTQPEVTQVSSLSDILKQLNQKLHEDRLDWHRIPDTQEEAAQYLLLYELSLPQGLGLDTLITYNYQATRVQAMLRKSDSQQILDIEQRIIEWANIHAPLLNITTSAGLDSVFASLTQRNINAMLEGTGIALVLISLFMIATLRSLKLGLLSMIPNLFPALVAYGVWGLTKGYVDTATSIVACLSLGIVVDDTVHFLSKYNYARVQLSKSVEESIRYSFHTIGMALLITSCILVSGIMVMEFSHFIPTQSMGQLLGLTLTIALVIDFLLLPPLLILFDKRRTKAPQYQKSIKEKLAYSP